MRNTWTGLGLLLVVPWLTSCVTRPEIRLDTGQGPPLVYTPPAAEPPPVEIRQEEFVWALTDLVVHMPLTLSPPPQRQGRRLVLASWGGSQDEAQQRLLSQCAPSEPPEGCLTLPKNAPPPETLARMRLALSYSMDSVWEGTRVPISEFLDPLAFKVMVYTTLSTYLVTLMMPDPFTKGLAAILTVWLVAYLGLGPVWAMVKASWQLLADSQRATTAEELKQAGQHYGRVMGDNGMRVLLLLATSAIGGRTSFLAKGPKLPGFPQAAAASVARTSLSLAAAGQVRTVVVGAQSLVVGLAPTAVAAVAMGPGGEALPEKKGSLTGRPKKPSPREKTEENLKAIARENESARLLAEKGYHVEQSPPHKPNGKTPDYKINGEYADCYAPTTENPRNIRGVIADKVSKEQADRIVLNLEGSPITLDMLKRYLLENPIAGLREIIVIRDGQIILFFPW